MVLLTLCLTLTGAVCLVLLTLCLTLTGDVCVAVVGVAVVADVVLLKDDVDAGAIVSTAGRTLLLGDAGSIDLARAASDTHTCVRACVCVCVCVYVCMCVGVCVCV